MTECVCAANPDCCLVEWSESCAAFVNTAFGSDPIVFGDVQVCLGAHTYVDCFEPPLGAGLQPETHWNDGSQHVLSCSFECSEDGCATCNSGTSCATNTECDSEQCGPTQTCYPALCDDGITNGNETDMDCGTEECGPCQLGRACLVDDNCTTGVCQDGQCRQTTCRNDQLDAGESDVDCGGVCGACPQLSNCYFDDDCLTNSCVNEKCQFAHCFNGIKDNGDESDIDCGLACGSTCQLGDECGEDTDCDNSICVGYVCTATCDDGLLNGTESGVDCGGRDCAWCGVGQSCRRNDDCDSHLCQFAAPGDELGVCAAATCGDGIHNGDESDVDCGGSCGVPCDNGQWCLSNSDCSSNDCYLGACRPEHCTDGVLDTGEDFENESDSLRDLPFGEVRDCGGPCGPCPSGSDELYYCSARDHNCESGSCGIIVCNPSTCDDGIQNQGETDVDCGAVCGTACRLGQRCTSPDDCDGGVCSNDSVCVPQPVMPPPLNPNIITPLHEAYAFLEQFGQLLSQPDTQVRQMSMLKGKVYDIYDQPLGGVTVTIKAHENWGSVVSDTLGDFAMGVLGGGRFTVVYQRPGFLQVQRQVEVSWGEVKSLPDVVMIHEDRRSVPVDLSTGEIAYARGSVFRDADGERQTTVLFRPDTVARAWLPDGSFRDFDTTIHLRSTEYTVGPHGPAAMPGALSPFTGYTYAVELDVDEAEAMGAVRVDFVQRGQQPPVDGCGDTPNPVVLYLDDFLAPTDVQDLPDGQTQLDEAARSGNAIPVGYFDRESGQWVDYESGCLVELTGTGPADAALVGDDCVVDWIDGEADKAWEIYGQPTRLWRVSLPHFSVVDLNHPVDCKGACVPPDVDEPFLSGIFRQPCEEEGSIIECEEQVMGETLGLAGTGLTLNYRSSRTPGYSPSSSVLISLLDPQAMAGLQSVQLKISDVMAGQVLNETFSATEIISQPTYRFDWEGEDAFGRDTVSSTFLNIELNYFYGGVRVESRSNRFGMPPGNRGYEPSISFRQRGENGVFVTTTEMRAPLFRFDARSAGFGGWTLSGHHFFDPVAGILFMGDGSKRQARARIKDLKSFAGGISADNPIERPLGMAFSTDGNLYVADDDGDQVLIFGLDGELLETLKFDFFSYHNGPRDPQCDTTEIINHDGGAGVMAPIDVAFDAQQRLYVAMRGQSCVLRGQRQNDTDPYVWEMVMGQCGQHGGVRAPDAIGKEGVPGTSLQLTSLGGIATANDGALYVVEGATFEEELKDYQEALTHQGPANHTLLRLSAGGFVTQIVGNGAGGVVHGCWTDYAQPGSLDPPNNDDSNRPMAARFRPCFPSGVATADDGSVYLASMFHHQVWKIAPSGDMELVVGGNGARDSAAQYTDGAPAKPESDDPLTAGTPITRPAGLRLSSTGELYITTVDGLGQNFRASNTVYKLDSAGRLWTVMGDGTKGSSNPSGSAGPNQPLNFPVAALPGPDGGVYISEAHSRRILRVGVDPPGYQSNVIKLPSVDGSLEYVFNLRGQHLYTQDTLTGQVLLSFEYDAETEALISATDLDGLQTTFERDVIGNVEVTGPYGHKTFLKVSTENGGYLTCAAFRGDGNQAPVDCDNPTPDTLSVKLDYDGQRVGLLTGVTDPMGRRKRYDYSDRGRLLRAYEPDSDTKFKELVRNEHLDEQDRPTGSYSVTFTRVDGSTSAHGVSIDEQRGQVRSVVHDGDEKRSAKRFHSLDGQTSTAELVGGFEFTQTRRWHPRWGFEAPLVSNTMTTPGGITLSAEHRLDEEVLDNNGLPTRREETLVPNGNMSLASRSVFERTAQDTTISHFSPLGRSSTQHLDEKGRVVLSTVSSEPDLDIYPSRLLYDAQGRVQKMVVGPLSEDPNNLPVDAASRVVTFVYKETDGADNGALEAVLDPMGRRTEFGHDLFGRLTQSRSMAQIQGQLEVLTSTSSQLDKNGNMTSIKPQDRPERVFAYDKRNLMINHIAPAPTMAASCDSDLACNDGDESDGDDVCQNGICVDCNDSQGCAGGAVCVAGQCAVACDDANPCEPALTCYEGLSQEPGGYCVDDTRVGVVTYDDEQRVQTAMLPGNRSMSFEYDQEVVKGRIERMTMTDGGVDQHIDFTYDDRPTNPNAELFVGGGRLTKVATSSGESLEYSWTYPSGTIEDESQRASTVMARGRTVALWSHEQVQMGGWMRQSINAQGALFQSEVVGMEGGLPQEGNPSDAAESAFYGYDNDGMLQTVCLGSAHDQCNETLELTTRPQSGLPDELVVEDGGQRLLRHQFGYNSFAEVDDVHTTFDGQTLMRREVVQRDKLGRLVEVRETWNVDGQQEVWSTTHSYDDLDRLVQAVQDRGDGQPSVWKYGYDTNGNRTVLEHPDGSIVNNISYNAQDQLLTHGQHSYEYDPMGRLLRRETDNADTRHFEYDLMGNLKSVVLPGGVEVRYQVDAHNNRIGRQKFVNGQPVQGDHQYWLYQNTFAPAAQLDREGRIVARFIYAADGHVPSMLVHYQYDANNQVSERESYRLVNDWRGSVRLVVRVSDGQVVQQFAYDPFGTRHVLQDSMGADFPMPFGFAGGLFDPETGLTRFGYRDYDPEIGRWTGKDPIGLAGGDTNFYAYVANDPINGIDPSGLAVETVADIGFLIYSVGALIYDNILRDCDNLGDNILNLFLDGVGLALPFVPGLGTGRKVLKGTIEAADKASDGAHSVSMLNKASNAAPGMTRTTRGAAELGGFAWGVRADEISEINRLFGGKNALNGHPSSVLANASRYEGFYVKAAVVVRGIAKGHLFDNGNKRTAHAVLDLLKSRNGVTTGVSDDATRRIIHDVATGELSDINDIASALRGF